MKIHTRWIVCLPLLAAVVVAAAAEEGKELSLKQAQQLDVQHHPRITIADLKTLVARQDIVAARSAYLPQVSGNISAVGVNDDNLKMANAGLTMSTVEQRASAGVTLSQLIYDFGRTGNLTESSRLRALAEERNALATRAQLLVQVNSAYFAALRAQQAEEALREEEDNITCDARIAWLNARNAAGRFEISAKLLQHARQSFALAQARYKVGASSIIELSQAQLNQTSAEIAQTSARYDYLNQRSLLDYQLGRIK